MIVMELHHDTRIISQILADCSFGETITLEAITRTIGRDILGCRHLLYSAMRLVERDIGAVFCSVRGVGYRRISSDELAKVGQTSRSRIRGHARRGVRTISNGLAVANDISPTSLRDALREQSILGLVEHTSKDRYSLALPETASEPMKPRDVARQFLDKMEAMKSK